jgi:transcriptional regulator with XRE-family HTH domain
VKPAVGQGADDLRRTLGENVRRLRRERRLSQHALGDLAGVSMQYVGLVESGRANPRSTTLGALASALGVAPVILLSPIDPGAKAAPDRSD